MTQIDYKKRAEEHIEKATHAVAAGALGDVTLAQHLEALARRIRRFAEKDQQPVATGAKYGRLCTANKPQYRQDVNYLYWETNCSVAQIAQHLGISQASIAKLIERKKT